MDKKTNKFAQNKKNNDKHSHKNKRKRMFVAIAITLSAIILSIVLVIVLSKKKKTTDLKPPKLQDIPPVVGEPDKPTGEQIIDSVVLHAEKDGLKSESVLPEKTTPEKMINVKPPYKETKTAEDKTSTQPPKDEDLEDVTLAFKKTENLPPIKTVDLKQLIQGEQTTKQQAVTKSDGELVITTHLGIKTIDKELSALLQDPVKRTDIPPCYTFPNGLKALRIAPFDLEDPKYKVEVIDVFSLYKESDFFGIYKDKIEIVNLLKTKEWKDFKMQHLTVLYCNTDNIMDMILVRSNLQNKCDHLFDGIRNMCFSLKIPLVFGNTAYEFLLTLLGFGKEYLNTKKKTCSIQEVSKEFLPDDYYKTPLKELQDTYRKSTIKIEDICNLKTMTDVEKNAYYKIYITYRLINIWTLFNDMKEALYQSKVLEDEEKLHFVDYYFDLTDRLIEELESDGLQYSALCDAFPDLDKAAILDGGKNVIAASPKPLVSTTSDPYALGIDCFSYDDLLGEEIKELRSYKGKTGHSRDKTLKTAEIVGKIGKFIDDIISDMNSKKINTIHFINRSKVLKSSAEELTIQTKSAINTYKNKKTGDENKDKKYLKKIEIKNTETIKLVEKNKVLFAAISIYNGLKECTKCPKDDISNSTLLESSDDFIAMIEEITIENNFEFASNHYSANNYIAMKANLKKLKRAKLLTSYTKELYNNYVGFLNWLGSKDMEVPKADEKISFGNHKDVFFALFLPLAHKRHMESALECDFRTIAKIMNDTHKIQVSRSNKTFEDLGMKEIDSVLFKNDPATEAVDTLIHNQKAARKAFDEGALYGRRSIGSDTE